MNGLRCWPGCLAYIVAPYKRRHELGLPVTVLRHSVPGETGATRSGGSWHHEPMQKSAWLCDASGPYFPRVIADVCLRPMHPKPKEDADIVAQARRTMEPSTAQWFIERHKRLAGNPITEA